MLCSVLLLNVVVSVMMNVLIELRWFLCVLMNFEIVKVSVVIVFSIVIVSVSLGCGMWFLVGWCCVWL